MVGVEVIDNQHKVLFDFKVLFDLINDRTMKPRIDINRPTMNSSKLPFVATLHHSFQ